MCVSFTKLWCFLSKYFVMLAHSITVLSLLQFFFVRTIKKPLLFFFYFICLYCVAQFLPSIQLQEESEYVPIEYRDSALATVSSSPEQVIWYKRHFIIIVLFLLFSFLLVSQQCPTLARYLVCILVMKWRPFVWKLERKFLFQTSTAAWCIWCEFSMVWTPRFALMFDFMLRTS